MKLSLGTVSNTGKKTNLSALTVYFSLRTSALLSVHLFFFLFPSSVNFASPLLISGNIARLQMRPYVPVCECLCVCVCKCNYVCLITCAVSIQRHRGEGNGGVVKSELITWQSHRGAPKKCTECGLQELLPLLSSPFSECLEVNILCGLTFPHRATACFSLPPVSPCPSVCLSVW